MRTALLLGPIAAAAFSLALACLFGVSFDDGRYAGQGIIAIIPWPAGWAVLTLGDDAPWGSLAGPPSAFVLNR